MGVAINRSKRQIKNKDIFGTKILLVSFISSCLYAKNRKNIVQIKTEIVIGKNVKGSVLPTRGSRIFKISPKKVMNNILTPIESSTLLIKSVFIFTIFSKRNPGMNVRKMKPKSCLKKKTLKITVNKVTVINIIKIVESLIKKYL
jgi:hypothetical protein